LRNCISCSVKTSPSAFIGDGFSTKTGGGRRVTALTASSSFRRETEVDARSLLNELLEFVSTEVNELGSGPKWRTSRGSCAKGPVRTGKLAVWERTQDMKVVVDHMSQKRTRIERVAARRDCRLIRLPGLL